MLGVVGVQNPAKMHMLVHAIQSDALLGLVIAGWGAWGVVSNPES